MAGLLAVYQPEGSRQTSKRDDRHKKYDKENNYKQLERGTGDAEKAVAADIFYHQWKLAESDTLYARLKKEWKSKYG